MQKTCQWQYCQKEFEAKRKDTKYCYDSHDNKCENCGKMYVIKHMKFPGKSCSKPCADALTKKATVASAIEKECAHCGDTFLALKSTDNYCKKDHMADCVVCGKSFKLLSMTRITKTCSKRCAAAITDFKARNEKSEAILMAEYGVRNASQLEEVKEKKRQTLLENYGVTNPSYAPEIKQKRENTFVERYGETNPMHVQEIKDRLAETNIERYGAASVFSLPEIQEKAQKSILAKYGVKNISQLEEFRTKAKQTTFERYGVESIFQLAEVQEKSFKANGKRISKLNQDWQRKIKEATGVEFALEYRVGDSHFFADLGHEDILIEINPTISHNSTIHFAHATGRCSA